MPLLEDVYHVGSLLASRMGCSGKAANLLSLRSLSSSVIPLSLIHDGNLCKMPKFEFAKTTPDKIDKDIIFLPI